MSTSDSKTIKSEWIELGPFHFRYFPPNTPFYIELHDCKDRNGPLSSEWSVTLWVSGDTLLGTIQVLAPDLRSAKAAAIFEAAQMLRKMALKLETEYSGE